MDAVSMQPSRQPIHSFVTSLDSFDTAINRFWETKEIPPCTSVSAEDRHCEKLFVQTTRRNVSSVGLSYHILSQGTHFASSTRIKLLLIDIAHWSADLNQMNLLSYSIVRSCKIIWRTAMELVLQPFPVDGQIYCLPYHDVVKLENETTKLRMVFDTSSKCPNGLSFNQMLLRTNIAKHHVHINSILTWSGGSNRRC